MQIVGRRRYAKNRDLEPHVKRDSRGYLSLVHPKLKKAYTFGKDLEKANSTARAINAHFAKADFAIRSILEPSWPTFGDVLDRYVKEHVPGLTWSDSYRAEQLRKIKLFRKYGQTTYNATDIRFFNELIDAEFSGGGKRHATFLLRLIDRFAVGKGMRKFNVADGILIAKKTKRKRNRIKDLEQFYAIEKEAPAWLKRAMRLALITLQPREVICSWKLPKASAETIKAVRGKTGALIEIRIGASLRKLFMECRISALSLGSRNLICRSPAKGSSVSIKPDMLTRFFAKAVEDSGLWESDPPTFHEIRSLGARLYKERGMPESEIQALLGHTKADTTKIYLDSGEPEYIQAKASMELG